MTLVGVAVIVELIVTTAATWVFVASHGRVYSADAVPAVAPDTALVLGSLVSDGEPGDYVRGRLDTTVDLYRRHVVTRIINSGNGSADAGNEPAVMRRYLEARGVPSAAIVDDPDGLDTDRSCRRARDVFGLRSTVIVTQDFHAGRAVALCRRAGVDAVAVEAACDCAWWSVVRNHLREAVFARPRALWSAHRPT